MDMIATYNIHVSWLVPSLLFIFLVVVNVVVAAVYTFVISSAIEAVREKPTGNFIRAVVFLILLLGLNLWMLTTIKVISWS